jgi:hypothetical protein
MLAEIAAVLANLPAIMGTVGGAIGIITGISVFARRRLRLTITITQNNDANHSWHTINIANRSDLSISYRDVAISWFITTPLGRRRLNWAYCPEDETDVKSLQPHTANTMRVDDEWWSVATPNKQQSRAYLRAYLHLPSKGRGVWLPVCKTTWSDDSWREKLIDRIYKVNQPNANWPLPPAGG